MARNVQAIDAERIPEGESLEPEDPLALADEDTGEARGEKQTITPLKRLLNDVPLEKMLSVLQSLQVSFTLSGRGHDFLSRGRSYQCTIWGRGILKYQACGRSPHDALVNVLTQFFMNEKQDIHEYPHG